MNFPVTSLLRRSSLTRAVATFGVVATLLSAALPVDAQNHGAPIEMLNYDGRFASAPGDMPEPVQKLVEAANGLQNKPYIWGGGHRFLNDRGYDCSGSVSYVLYKAGLIQGPLTARQFHEYGAPGPGHFITLFVKDDHVFIAVCGLRFDTSDHGANRGKGPKWRPTARTFAGFEVRHIPGL